MNWISHETTNEKLSTVGETYLSKNEGLPNNGNEEVENAPANTIEVASQELSESQINTIAEEKSANSNLNYYSTDKTITEPEIKKTKQTTIAPTKSSLPVNEISKKPLMSDDLKLILCLILALIIPPLGMYLWNEMTDKWFTIDLVLFLFIFLFVFGPYGFLWLGSVVIAILRVFDQL